MVKEGSLESFRNSVSPSISPDKQGLLLENEAVVCQADLSGLL